MNVVNQNRCNLVRFFVEDCKCCGPAGLASSYLLRGTKGNRLFLRNRTQQSHRASFTTHNDLPTPEIVFQNNHLLVVNKPPGWSSTPSPTRTTQKCLLTYLQREKLGGGSQQTFLRPLHRLDQPCSGLLVFGKTSKAASRIQPNWKTGVQKTYLIVLDGNEKSDKLLDKLRRHSSDLLDADHFMELKGHMVRNRRQNNGMKQNSKGWSVTMLPWEQKNDKSQEKDVECDLLLCSLQWKQVMKEQHSPFVTLQIRTNQGARHMIRALLACYECPIAGDVRYSAQSSPLADQSVALHAIRLELSSQKIRLGNLQQRDFYANIPKTWQDYFQLNNDHIRQELIQ